MIYCMSSNIDATQQGGGVVGGVGGMLTFLARCTNIDATQHSGGVVGGTSGCMNSMIFQSVPKTPAPLTAA